jgi:hypothetical protein
MLRNGLFSVSFVTGYLVTYIILLSIQSTLIYAIGMLLFSPVLVLWMVYTVLKYGKYDGKELGNDEFGYHDKKKDELGVF